MHLFLLAALAAALALSSAQASAQAPTLRQAFDAAWARQPEALALPLRRDAAQAAWRTAQAWTPAAPALELLAKTDRPGRNQGGREADAGVSVPLWLPGERRNSTALAQAEDQAIDSRSAAAQWRVAAAVRDAWWAWQRAHADAGLAQLQLANATAVAADVARRVQAGDLARADQHQADGAVAEAESAAAEAGAALGASRHALQALTGIAWNAVPAGDATAPESPPREPPEFVDATAAHPALRELRDRIAIARHAAALAAVQSRANPELTLSVGRERGVSGDATRQTVSVGVRIPFGGGARHGARVASAAADMAELQAQLALQQAQLLAQAASARSRLHAARVQLAAAERRALLADASRGFFDKSFRLGETDLPTRLRTEAAAADAARRAARARIDLAAAVSGLRQALGLLPE